MLYITDDAGILWRFLDENGESCARQIVKRTELSNKSVQRAAS